MTQHDAMRIRTPLDLGLIIRDRRRKLGLTQNALAEKAAVGRQWLVAVEQGKARAEIGLVLRTLAALDVELYAGGNGQDGTTATTKAILATPVDDVVSAHKKDSR